jgi:Zn-dependent protease
LAGPANQLLIWGILFGLLKLKLISIPPDNQIFYILIIQILMVNLYWPLFNLLPIFPLDGGRVVRESAMALLGNRGMRASLWVSIVICGGMIAWIVAAGGSMFNAMIFGMMLANNIQEIQFLRDQDRYRDPSDWRS